jgi:hypothetical protein
MAIEAAPAAAAKAPAAAAKGEDVATMDLHGPARVGGNDVKYQKNSSNATQPAGQVLAERITGLRAEDSDFHADISVDGQKISFAEEE